MGHRLNADCASRNVGRIEVFVQTHTLPVAGQLLDNKGDDMGMSQKTINPPNLQCDQSNKRINDLKGRVKDLECQLQVAQKAANEWRALAFAARDDAAHWRDLYGRPR
jgi:hypothetical protein